MLRTILFNNLQKCLSVKSLWTSVVLYLEEEHFALMPSFEKEKEHSLSIVFSIPNIIKHHLHVWLSSMQQRGAYTIKIVKYLRQNNCQILCGATAPPDSVSCPLLGVNCELVKSSVFPQTRTSQLRHVMRWLLAAHIVEDCSSLDTQTLDIANLNTQYFL